MKKLLVATLLGGFGLLAVTAAQAQSAAPDFPTASPSPKGSSEAGARRSKATAEELLREQRRANMSPEEQNREKQIDILEARTGMLTNNTSLSRRNPDRQFDKSSGGFQVRKYKAKPGSEQKRGTSRSMGGSANPKGKPLVHNNGRKRFLIF